MRRFSLALLGLALLAAGAALLPGLAGQVAVYPWLGLLPGLALSRALLPRSRALTRVTLGLTISPLVSAAAGWLLWEAGLGFAAAARTVAVLGGLAWALLAAPRPAGVDEGGDPPLPRVVPLWGVLLAVAVLLPRLLNRYVAVWGDSWVHAGISWEILERGLPPQDPRFAGLGLNYVWFFNLFLALLTSFRGQDPLVFMGLFNAANAFATVGLAALLGLTLWRTSTAAVGAVALLTLGLNAGAYLLWPLILIRAFTGQVRGWTEGVRLLGHWEFGTVRVVYNLAAPFAYMVNFLDKFIVGTALSHAYLLMMLYLWSLLAWLQGGRRTALAWTVLSAAGMLFFHGVVGLSVVPVAFATLALTLALRPRSGWLPTPGRLLAAAAATLCGAALALPYTLAIATGWAGEKSGLAHSYFSPGVRMPWTIVTGCAVALWFARRPLASLRQERAPQAAMLALFLGGMALFACAVRLPDSNEAKFVYEVFVPAVLLAAPAFAAWVQGLWRGGRARAALVLAVLFLVPPLLTLHGFLAEPGGRADARLHPRPGERALYQWIRRATPTRAVFLDYRFRDAIMVEAGRQLYLGTSQGPEKAAFPARELTRRRAVMADVFGPVRDPESDVRSLERLGRPVCVLYRAEDTTMVVPAWKLLLERTRRFEAVYDQDGFHVLAMVPESGPRGAASPPGRARKTSIRSAPGRHLAAVGSRWNRSIRPPRGSPS